ncbi:MAG: helix-turn-helix domain-containing protein [Patescibacteria group bacterium]
MAFLQKRIHAATGGFGETLRELRELRGYSIDDLSRATGIHGSVLKAFEEERLEEIADPYYAERHIRTIVKALEGREPYVMEKYHALLTARGILKPSNSLARARVRKRDLFVSSRAIGFIGFLLLVAAIVGYVFWQATLIGSQPPLSVVSPADGMVLATPHVDVTGHTDPSALVDVNGVQAVVDVSGNFQASLDVPRGLTTLEVEAKRRYGSAAIVERHVTYNGEPISATSTFPEIATSTSSTAP